MDDKPHMVTAVRNAIRGPVTIYIDGKPAMTALDVAWTMGTEHVPPFFGRHMAAKLRAARPTNRERNRLAAKRARRARRVERQAAR